MESGGLFVVAIVCLSACLVWSCGDALLFEQVAAVFSVQCPANEFIHAHYHIF